MDAMHFAAVYSQVQLADCDEFRNTKVELRYHGVATRATHGHGILRQFPASVKTHPLQNGAGRSPTRARSKKKQILGRKNEGLVGCASASTTEMPGRRTLEKNAH